MPVSKKRVDWKHLSSTGQCKTIKGKQVQNGDFHVPELTRPFDISAMMKRFPNFRSRIAEVITKAANKRAKLKLNVKPS